PAKKRYLSLVGTSSTICISAADLETMQMRDTSPHEPTDKTRAEVSALYSFGIPQEDIARYIGVDAKTLRKYYRDELDNSVTKANAAVGRFLYQNATGNTLKDGASHSDCVRAAMFWAKTRMGWSETQKLEHTSPDGSMTPRDSGAAVLAALQRKHDDAK